jgi:hypothetical protein
MKETKMSSLPKMPAYQEYPADILNNEVFMQLSMAQRGMLWTLRMYCWKNETIPAGFKNIAKLTGISENEASKLFDEKVGSFFEIVHDKNLDNKNARMFNPDLEAYRKAKIAARDKRAVSGKLGADKRWSQKEDGGTITSAIAKEKRRHEHDYDPEHDFEKHMNMKGYQSLN